MHPMLLKVAAAAALASGVFAGTAAEARHGYHGHHGHHGHYGRGAAIVGGAILGGLALGALASRPYYGGYHRGYAVDPYYAPPPPPRPAYGYAPAPYPRYAPPPRYAYKHHAPRAYGYVGKGYEDGNPTVYDYRYPYVRPYTDYKERRLVD